MATLVPAPSNVEAAYEDMFKEITRKLYGEETGNGLHTLGTPVAQVATTGPTAPEGERSFTNLQIDRTAAPTIEYEHNAGGGIVTTAGGNAVSTSASSVSTTATVQAQAQAAAAAAAAAVVIQQQPEGSVVVVPTSCGNNFIKSEDQLSTAFGLAALMQNGFASSGTILSTQALNKVVANAANQQQQTVNDAQQQQARWNNDNSGAAVAEQQQQQATQLVQWTTTSGGKLQSFTTTQQPQQQQQQLVNTPKTKSKHRHDHSTPVTNSNEVLYASPSTSAGVVAGLNASISQQATPSSASVTPNTSASSSSSSNGPSAASSSRKKSSHQQSQGQNNASGGGVQVVKRYACTHCPYSTDRRDLYTRHENIHKDEKPFQCYACLKQFNRADHVKKHFLRMHREMQYDINKTRRHVANNSTAASVGTTHHAGGRGNVTIPAAASLHLDDAFLEAQRQPTSSSLSIAETIEAVATAADEPLPQLKQEKNDDGTLVGSVGGVGAAVTGGTNGIANIKPKREKRFTCCYCPWSGADKWGLKRHLNTHTKPFVCLLCEYKAARSERLATHVLKVHNKRACNKCSFLADTQEEYQSHVNEVHPHDNRPARHSGSSNNTNGHNNSNNTINNTNNESSNANAAQTTNNANTNATNNLNVLRTIGNTLVANNNQLNTFQNTNNNFGIGNQTATTTTNAIGNAAGGSVTIYTTTTTNDNGSHVVGGNITGGPLQEIIVNPTSMVGWRLSANGSLIPPHDLLTGTLPTAAAQKRGSERLFQYLEADGSDPEDYARLLKMDAISRNTASVAQDFHKAGGVHELKVPANHQLLFNNKLPSQWTTREAAALLHSLSNMHYYNNNNNNDNNTTTIPSPQQRSSYAKQQQQQQVAGIKRLRHHSTGDEDDEHTPSSSASSTTSNDGLSPWTATRIERKPALLSNGEQRRAMTAFLGKNFELQEAAHEQTTTTTTPSTASSNTNKRKQHVQQQSETQKVFIKQEIDEENQENQEQLILTSPAFNKTNTNQYNNNYNTKMRTNNSNQRQNNKDNSRNATNHRLDLQRHNLSNNKENKVFSQPLGAGTVSGTALPLPLPLPTSTTTSTAANFLTQMEYQNLNKIGTQFQNYVKDIINKYYAETPLMFPAMPTATTTPQQSQQQQPANSDKRKRMLSETEEYIEYLKNKEDITLTITPKQPTRNLSKPSSTLLRCHEDLTLIKRTSPKRGTGSLNVQTAAPQPSIPAAAKPRKSLTQIATLLPLLADAASQQQYLAAPLDFSIKSEQKPKIEVNTPSAPVAAVNERTILPERSDAAKRAAVEAAAAAAAALDKRSSRKQAQPKKIRTPPEVVIAMLRDKYLNLMVNHKLRCNICRNNQQLVFHYHSKASLALHRRWKHANQYQACKHCSHTFKHKHSLSIHLRVAHGSVAPQMRAKPAYNCKKPQQKRAKTARQQRSLKLAR